MLSSNPTRIPRLHAFSLDGRVCHAMSRSIHLPAEIVSSITSDLVAEYIHNLFVGAQEDAGHTSAVPWNAIFALLSVCRFWNGVTRSILVSLFCESGAASLSPHEQVSISLRRVRELHAHFAAVTEDDTQDISVYTNRRFQEVYLRLSEGRTFVDWEWDEGSIRPVPWPPSSSSSCDPFCDRLMWRAYRTILHRTDLQYLESIITRLVYMYSEVGRICAGEVIDPCIHWNLFREMAKEAKSTIEAWRCHRRSLQKLYMGVVELADNEGDLAELVQSVIFRPSTGWRILNAELSMWEGAGRTRWLKMARKVLAYICGMTQEACGMKKDEDTLQAWILERSKELVLQ